MTAICSKSRRLFAAIGAHRERITATIINRRVGQKLTP